MTRTPAHLRHTIALCLCLGTPLAAAGFGDLLKKIEQQLPATTDSGQGAATSSSTLDSATLSAGLKDALRVGAERAVAQLAAGDGFLANPRVHIPLPASIQQASPLLDRFGLGALREQLEVSMNRAAEQAAPAAAAHLQSAQQAMTIDDAQRIFAGPDDAATRYFESKRGAQIGADFTPIIRAAMDQVGVTRDYQQRVDQASRYPLVGSLNLDLEQHVTRAALDGLFTKQEALIRKDPVARTTDLLKQVFGGYVPVSCCDCGLSRLRRKADIGNSHRGPPQTP